VGGRRSVCNSLRTYHFPGGAKDDHLEQSEYLRTEIEGNEVEVLRLENYWKKKDIYGEKRNGGERGVQWGGWARLVQGGGGWGGGICR